MVDRRAPDDAALAERSLPARALANTPPATAPVAQWSDIEPDAPAAGSVTEHHILLRHPRRSWARVADRITGSAAPSTVEPIKPPTGAGRSALRCVSTGSGLRRRRRIGPTGRRCGPTALRAYLWLLPAAEIAAAGDDVVRRHGRWTSARHNSLVPEEQGVRVAAKTDDGADAGGLMVAERPHLGLIR